MPQEYPIILRGFPCKVARVDDLTYVTRGGRPLLADLYIPEEPQRPLPVILFLHAGGWAEGDRRFGPDLGRFFAERGFAMASVDYRLSGDATFPAAVHDVKTAVRWLRSIAGEYGLDANRIGIWGLSAGGHLAALAALSGPQDFVATDDPYQEFAGAVQAVVAGYPPIDFLQMDSHGGADSYEAKFLGAPIAEVPELVRQASPAAYIKSGAPPFLLVHGLADTAVPVAQSELLFDALGVAGNDVTLCLVDGLGHGFMNRNNFDQGTFPRMRKYECRNGEGPVVSEAPPFTFGTVETYFKRWL
ncbi:MAG TPA: alpha/beta hydrolase [Bryobacteraceae bacterium]|nr:alpha/beta hydrolase [Bryobacteraceae bacterium]